MEERKGPDYIPASIWMAKRERSRRRVRWSVPPLIGIGLAVLFVRVWVPQRAAETKVDELVRFVRFHPEYRTQEYRLFPDHEELVRRDFVEKARRRSEMLGGEVVFMNLNTGWDPVIERTPGIFRRHMGATLVNAGPVRLIADCIDMASEVSTGPQGSVIVTVRSRQHQIFFNPDGSPKEWTTSIKTDRAMEAMVRTTVEWGLSDPKAFDATAAMAGSTEVSEQTRRSPFEGRSKPLAVVGDLTILRAHVNALGDLVIAYRSRVEKPAFTIVDQRGRSYASVPLYTDGGDGDGTFVNESLCFPLDDAKPTWPVEFTVVARTYDPRLGEAGVPPEVMGTWKGSFKGATCSYWPPHWFNGPMADRPYLSFFRNRSYQRALALQEAMRTTDNRVVDAKNGTAVGHETKTLHKDPKDLTAAIGEMRNVIRYRAEVDGGSISLSQLYLTLARMEKASGELDDARRTVRFLLEDRQFRQDQFVIADAELLAKELEE